MRHLFTAFAITAAVSLGGGVARADDPSREAHAIMRAALLEHASHPIDREDSRSAMTAGREHMDRVRRAEAEREAHHRAVEHGTRRSGMGSSGRDMGVASDPMHGGSRSSDSWGMECHDAAGNRRTMDTHDEWMPGGGMDHGGGGGMPLAPAPEEKPGSTAGLAPEAPPHR